MQHLYIKISKFNFAHPEWFSRNQLIDWSSFTDWEKKVLDLHFLNAFNSSYNTANSTMETMFILIERISTTHDWDVIRNSKYALKSEAFFNYLDYLEFQEARKASKQAMWTAIWAIIVSILAIVIQIYTSISTQIDEKQFIEIKNLVSSEVKK